MWMHADKYACNSHLKYNDAYMWMHTNALLRTRMQPVQVDAREVALARVST